MKRTFCGSAMVWVICTLAVLMILVLGVLAMSSVYFNRCTEETSKRQANYTARTAVNIVQKKITEDTDSSAIGGYADKLGIPTDITFNGYEKSMGKCTVTVTKNADIITVTASASCLEQNAVVCGILKFEPIPSQNSSSLNGWVFKGYLKK